LGFTKSHQVVLDFGGYKQGKEIAEKLQRANIIVDCVVRLGTCEVTRRGMKEEEMAKIAELIKRTVLDGENPEIIKNVRLLSYVQNFRALNTVLSDEESSLL